MELVSEKMGFETKSRECGVRLLEPLMSDAVKLELCAEATGKNGAVEVTFREARDDDMRLAGWYQMLGQYPTPTTQRRASSHRVIREKRCVYQVLSLTFCVYTSIQQ